MKRLMLAVLIGLSYSATADAAFSSGGYCVGGTPTGGISVSDVTLTDANGVTGNADNCYGLVDFGGDVTNEIDNINALGWGTWSTANYLKDDLAGSATATFLGWDWTLAADNTSNNSAWTLSITDPDLLNPPSLPFTIDILVFLKAGNPGAFYLFEDAFVDDTNPGTFTISWVNNGGQNPALSGMSLFFKEPVYTSSSGTVVTSTGGVPEPGTVGLLGAGIVGGLFAYRRRKQRTS